MKKSTLAAVLGNVVSLIALWLVNFGVELSAEDQASIVSALLLIVNTCALIIPAVLAGMKRPAPRDPESGHGLPEFMLALGVITALVVVLILPGCGSLQAPTPNNTLVASSKALQVLAEDIGAAQKSGQITVEYEAALLDHVQFANDELRRAQRLMATCQPDACAEPAALLQWLDDYVVRIRSHLAPPEPLP